MATAVSDFNRDGLPDVAFAYVIEVPGAYLYVSISVLLNDSPGDGFTVTGVSSATGTWPVAPGSLVTAYGVNLAASTEAAASIPLPTTLGGIRLHVRDRNHTEDTVAPLLYFDVSSSAALAAISRPEPVFAKPGRIGRLTCRLVPTRFG
jgi:hypothetical protein